MREEFQEMKDALIDMVKMFDYLCNKINWGKSYLDAKAIKMMNETPARAHKVIERVTGLNYYFINGGFLKFVCWEC